MILIILALISLMFGLAFASGANACRGRDKTAIAFFIAGVACVVAVAICLAKLMVDAGY